MNQSIKLIRNLLRQRLDLATLQASDLVFKEEPIKFDSIDNHATLDDASKFWRRTTHEKEVRTMMPLGPTAQSSQQRNHP